MQGPRPRVAAEEANPLTITPLRTGGGVNSLDPPLSPLSMVSILPSSGPRTTAPHVTSLPHVTSCLIPPPPPRPVPAPQSPPFPSEPRPTAWRRPRPFPSEGRQEGAWGRMAVNQSHTENRRGAVIPFGERCLVGKPRCC